MLPRIIIIVLIVVRWITPSGPAHNAENPTNKDAILLHVLPQRAGELRYQSTIRENEIVFSSALDPDAKRIKIVEARTEQIYLRNVSSDTVEYSRQRTRTAGSVVDNFGDKRFTCELIPRYFKSFSDGCERGDGVDRFDSDRADHRAHFEEDRMRFLLATREDVVERSDGSTLRYDAIGPVAEVNAAWRGIVEREMENGVVMFAAHPVRIDATWPMGRFELSDPRVGIVTRDVEGRLDRVVTGGLPGLAPDEPAAVVTVTGRNFVHRFDADSAAAVHLKDKLRMSKFEETGQILFSLARREIVTDVRKLVLEFGVEDDRGQSAILFSISQTMRKGRGTIEEVVNPPAKALPFGYGAASLSLERERSIGPKDSFKECDSCPEMVVVPTGTFMMGSQRDDPEHSAEKPQHRVTFAKPFAVGKYEITVDQYAAFVAETNHAFAAETNHDDASCSTGQDVDSTSTGDPLLKDWSTGIPLVVPPLRDWSTGDPLLKDLAGVPPLLVLDLSFRNPGFPQTGSHPAVCVSWNDAKRYVEWLARKTGRPYRLLSEAEWEYAARAESTAADGSDNIQSFSCASGNVGDETARKTLGGEKNYFARCSDGYAFTAPVGRFPANSFGLHDIVGNASELVEDCRNDSYTGAPEDGTAWVDGMCWHRMKRGGSWDWGPNMAHPAERDLISLKSRRDSVGFRVARTLHD